MERYWGVDLFLGFLFSLLEIPRHLNSIKILIVAVMFASVFIEQVAIKKHEIHYGELVIEELKNGQLASFGPYPYAHHQFLKEKEVVKESEVIHYAYNYYLGEV